MADATLHEQAEKLFVMVEKLFNETARLRRDIQTLSNRIEPFDGEQSASGPSLWDGQMKTFKEAFDVIEQARRNIRNGEYDLSAIRARIDDIANDSLSRDEMKPWLKGG